MGVNKCTHFLTEWAFLKLSQENALLLHNWYCRLRKQKWNSITEETYCFQRDSWGPNNDRLSARFGYLLAYGLAQHDPPWLPTHAGI